MVIWLRLLPLAWTVSPHRIGAFPLKLFLIRCSTTTTRKVTNIENTKQRRGPSGLNIVVPTCLRALNPHMEPPEGWNVKEELVCAAHGQLYLLMIIPDTTQTLPAFTCHRQCHMHNKGIRNDWKYTCTMCIHMQVLPKSCTTEYKEFLPLWLLGPIVRVGPKWLLTEYRTLGN